MGNERVTGLEAFNRPFRKYFSTEELTEGYFYTNLVGNLGLIRRSVIQDLFKGKKEVVLNYSPNSSPRAGISQIIFRKEHVDSVLEGLTLKI